MKMKKKWRFGGFVIYLNSLNGLMTANQLALNWRFGGRFI
jgi:hypothetical protein